MVMDREPPLLRFTAFVALFGAILYGAWFSQASESAETSLGSSRQAEIAKASFEDAPPIDWLFSKVYSDMEPTTELPEITGDSSADERIREIALQRGYELWPLYSGELEEIEGVLASEELVDDWRDLAVHANEVGEALVLERGFVSFEEAQEEFVDRLHERAHNEIGREYSVEQIGGGTADAVINAVLREYPIPGFTPYHSGYVLRVSLEHQDFLAANAHKFNFELSKDVHKPDSLLLVWMGEKSDDQ